MTHQINANMMTPPNMICEKFIVAAVTGVARGQKAKNHRGKMEQIAPMLIASPKRPSDHRRGGKGAPHNRLQTRHPIVTMYEVRTDTPPKELIALRAVVEPRLMQANNEVTIRDTRTERTGKFHPRGTCK